MCHWRKITDLREGAHFRYWTINILNCLQLRPRCLFLTMCCLINIIFALIAVFVSDDPFIFSSWDEFGENSTVKHRSEQTSIITSPRAPIGNESEINRSAMQVTIDQFFLAQTVHHFYHIPLACCYSIVWPRRVVWQPQITHPGITTFYNFSIQVRNYSLMHIDSTTACFICWPTPPHHSTVILGMIIIIIIWVWYLFQLHWVTVSCAHRQPSHRASAVYKHLSRDWQ